MKITERMLRGIIRNELSEVTGWDPPRRKRSFYQASPTSLSVARSTVRKVKRLYPGADIKIRGRDGWILVNGKKLINISSSRLAASPDMWKDKIIAALQVEEEVE